MGGRRAFLTTSAFCALWAGCSSSGRESAPAGRDGVLVYVDVAASRAGLPPMPDIVDDERSESALRRAERAYARAVDAAVPAVERALHELGAREVSVRRGPAHPHPYLRARVPAGAIARVERRADVAGVRRVSTLTGEVERDDLVLLLVADDGRDYVLGQVGTHGLRGGERVEVEGSIWRGASTVWHPRGHNFIAREVRRL